MTRPAQGSRAVRKYMGLLGAARLEERFSVEAHGKTAPSPIYERGPKLR